MSEDEEMSTKNDAGATLREIMVRSETQRRSKSKSRETDQELAQ